MPRFEWQHTATARTIAHRQRAVELGGGPSHVARELGVARPYLEKIRAGGNLDPRIARGLVKLCGGGVTLKQLAPEQFADLTQKELGYLPKPE